MYGELIPLGGGDPIPLLKKQLLVGRRESCDIVLRFANVSAHHCQLFVNGGYWYIRDMQSRNGVKVNGIRVQEKRVDPGDTLSIAKHDYELILLPRRFGGRRSSPCGRSAQRDHERIPALPSRAPSPPMAGKRPRSMRARRPTGPSAATMCWTKKNSSRCRTAPSDRWV